MGLQTRPQGCSGRGLVGREAKNAKRLLGPRPPAASRPRQGRCARRCGVGGAPVARTQCGCVSLRGMPQTARLRWNLPSVQLQRLLRRRPAHGGPQAWRVMDVRMTMSCRQAACAHAAQGKATQPCAVLHIGSPSAIVIYYQPGSSDARVRACILAQRCCAVGPRECRCHLSRLVPIALPIDAPQGQHARLQRPPVAERQRPRRRRPLHARASQRVECVEVDRCLLCGV